MDRPLVYNPNIDLNNNSFMQNDMSNNMSQNIHYNPNIDNVNYMNDNSIMSNHSIGMSMGNQNMGNHNMSNHNMSNYTMSNQGINIPSTNNNFVNENFSRPKNKYEFLSNNNTDNSNLKTKCKSFFIKVLFITGLYVVISHHKFTLLLCNNTPYLCITNAIMYNTIKGLIFGIILYFTYNIL